MDKENLGTLFALMTAVISGFAIVINKIFVAAIEPTLFTAVRAFFIGLGFFALSYWQYRKSGFNPKKFKIVSWKYLVSIGVIGGGLAFLLFFHGLSLTTSGRAAFLHKTLPIWITLLAIYFLKERVTRKQLAYLAVMFFGVLLIFYSQINPADMFPNPQLGDFLIIGATILWAIENTIARKAMLKKESNWVISFSRMFIGSLVLFSALIILGKLDLLFKLSLDQVIKITVSTLILFGYVFFWYWSIKLINASKASTLLLIAPVISLILGVILLGEPAPFIQLLGSALILVGAFEVGRIKSELTTGV